MTALINFRKILNENFLLFIISLFLYLQIFNALYTNESEVYNILREVKLLIPFAITYVFVVVILTPFTKFMFFILSYIQFFPTIEKIIDMFKSDEKDNYKDDYISFDRLKTLAVEFDSSNLYNIYLYHKDEEEKEIFTSKFSFLNIILIFLNYLIVENGIVQYIINLSEDKNIFLVSSAIFLELLIIIMFLYAIQYMKPDNYKISKKDIEGTKNITKHRSE